MSRRRVSIVAGVAWCALASWSFAQDEAIGVTELERRLAAAVDAPDARARAAAARELAKLPVSVEQWLSIMRGFGRFEPAESGVREETVELTVDGKVEATRIAVFVPESYDPERPTPLMLAAHGTGGRGRGELSRWRGVAQEIGMLIVAPTEAGPNDGYRFSRRERLATLAAIRWVRRRFNVDENRIHASGTSRGGHLVWDLAMRYPDRFASIAPMIGGPRWNLAAGQNNLRYVENITAIPIRDLQGVGDDPRMLFNLRWAFELLRKHGAVDAQLLEQAGHGHSYDFSAVKWAEWLGKAKRSPVPGRVVRRSARLDEARSHWLEIARLDRKVAETFRPKVKAAQWNALDDSGRRKYIQKMIDERTARAEVTMKAPGRFVGKGVRARSVRLLLTEAMLDDKRKASLRFGSKTKRVSVSAKPSPRVLLREFVERFDRTFLPIAEIKS